MTDIHQHLLWGMDDGPETREEMFAMLRQAQQQGIGAVAATPHAAPGIRPFDPGIYRERLEEARQFCREDGLSLRVLSGAEITWTYQSVLALRQGRIPTLEDTDYVLLELWRNVSWQQARDAVNELIRSGYCPVLAHPERYLAFVMSPRAAIRFRKETGALLQLNADTLLHPRSIPQRRFAGMLLDRGAVDAVASDAHGSVHRPVNLREARQWLIKHTDEAYADSVTTFGGVFL